ncbi:MAG: aminodeoxychorismate synthase component I [Reichenbachiella sp.]|uniref:aminodeoxychorismate synthase component I n=1 Tax=Reichenbachiella sp. TaxID=2184521 RepID=UPI0032657383
MNKEASIQEINKLAKAGIPFLLITDFKGTQNHVLTLDQIDPENILYDINGVRNFDDTKIRSRPIRLKKEVIAPEIYQSKFNRIHKEIAAGNTYLLNLTQPTNIESSSTLKEIFYQSKAKYKLYFQNQFVVFSPEIFIKIENRKMSSYPMKGTIDADLDRAEEKLLSSAKEMAEHATIVDLIRNDMSQYASNVKVEKFRYIEEIKTNEKHLLQASSKIIGDLPADFKQRLGEMIYSLLPAGSISGAPKQKTLEIIESVEGYDRGYYTGIVGYFDGENFDSGVLIRYIENKNEQLTYKSGGGIHFLSDWGSEYQEMIDKVYVPVH